MGDIVRVPFELRWSPNFGQVAKIGSCS
jgi:hypothetical protein